MAKTNNPSAATRKAWLTRKRNADRSGASATVTARAFGVRGIDDAPRWKGSDEWLNEHFGKVLKKLPGPVRKALDRFLPSVHFDASDPYQRGGYYRYTGSIKVGPSSSDSDIVHEVGHALDHALNIESRKHPGAGTLVVPGQAGTAPWAAKFWSERDRAFQRAFKADVRELKKRTEDYRDWEYTAEDDAEGFAASFAHAMGFPKEWGGGGVKPGFERAFPKTLAAVKKKLKAEGWL